jgi:SH3-like domain-containing protein
MHVRHLLVIGASAVVSVGWAAAASAAPVSHSVTSTSPASVRPAASCGWQPANNSNSPSSFTGNGVNIRTGPSTSCTSKGLGYTSHGLRVRCVDLADDWDYVTDTTTGVTGWVADQYVGGYAAVQC